VKIESDLHGDMQSCAEMRNRQNLFTNFGLKRESV